MSTSKTTPATPAAPLATLGSVRRHGHTLACCGRAATRERKLSWARSPQRRTRLVLVRLCLGARRPNAVLQVDDDDVLPLRVHTPVAASSRAMPVVTMMAYSVESPIGVGGRLPEVTVEVGGNLEAAASLGIAAIRFEGAAHLRAALREHLPACDFL